MWKIFSTENRIVAVQSENKWESLFICLAFKLQRKFPDYLLKSQQAHWRLQWSGSGCPFYFTLEAEMVFGQQGRGLCTNGICCLARDFVDVYNVDALAGFLK